MIKTINYNNSEFYYIRSTIYSSTEGITSCTFILKRETETCISFCSIERNQKGLKNIKLKKYN